jgi:Restriction endonuclease
MSKWTIPRPMRPDLVESRCDRRDDGCWSLRCLSALPLRGDDPMHSVQGKFWEPDIVTASDVEVAQSAYARARAVWLDAQRRLSRVNEREGQLTAKLTSRERLRSIRRLCDDTTTRPGGFGILMFCTSILVLIPCHLIGLPLRIWPIPILAVLGLMVFVGTKLFKPDDAKLRSDLDSWNRELGSIQGQKWGLEAEISETKSLADRARLNYENINKHFESRINRLRSTDCEVLQGVPFEQFLESIFVEWGYEVETTKITGDQGVDLIVSKRGVRTAVQAKGYSNSTVGNSAVQDAETGM